MLLFSFLQAFSDLMIYCLISVDFQSLVSHSLRVTEHGLKFIIKMLMFIPKSLSHMKHENNFEAVPL